MLHSTDTIRHSLLRWAAGLLSVLVFLVYSNTFHASWHLDDYQNILTNSRIQIDELSVDALKHSAYGPVHQKTWRPVAFMSFAFNWYAGQQDVVGYHLVNLLVHLITSLVLYLVINSLLQAPVLEDRYAKSRHFIALLATAMWAIHPIQTQAVTYIVQRMTLLSGMFYLIGIYCYIRIRSVDDAGPRFLWTLGLLAAFLLGLGSKENIVLLPLSLVLIELTFFSDRQSAFWNRRTIIVIAGALAAGLTAFWLLDVDLGRVFNGYRNRFFTPGQRMLTEFRVLIFYISQLLYPIPGRFSIEHDFELSTSMLSPWTTLPAVILVLGLIGIAIWQMRKRPLASFAVLFFFLNHGLESTIIPLELVFEHRNYLPSAFFFMPLAALLWHGLHIYRRRDRRMYAFITGFGVLLLVGLGAGTYVRNYAWATEWSLWMDARKKAPAMCRPVINLAWSHFEVNRQWGAALSTYNSALKRKMHRRDTRSVIFNNMADIYFRTGNFGEAEIYWRRAIEAAPAVTKYRYRLVLAIAKQKRWETALVELDPLLKMYPDSVRYLNLKGNIMLYRQQPGPALEAFSRCLKLKPQDPIVLSNAGVAHLALGGSSQAEILLKSAVALEPDDNLRLMQLIGIYLINDNAAKADIHLQRLLARSSVKQIRMDLEKLANEPGCERLHQVLGRHLAGVLADKSRQINTLPSGWRFKHV